jgi:DNA-binding MarR family transcriptional regulator
MSTTPSLPPGISDSPAHRVANVLHSAAIRVLRRARAVDSESGLTPERLSLLSILCFAGPKTVGELALAEMVSRPAISRTLNGLEALGLVRRTRTARDRRQVVVKATARGRRVMDGARKRRLERIAGDLSRLPPGALDTLEAATGALEGVGRSSD